MKKFTRCLTACILGLLFVFAGVFSSFANGNSQIDDETIQTIVESVLSEITASSEEVLASSVEMYESYGMPEIANGFRSYQELLPVLGEYQSTGEASHVENEDGSITVSTPVTFAGGTAYFVLEVGSDGYISEFSFTTDSQGAGGSLGASMKNAAVNLVVGMGTVFLVLIFLCWVISLFKNVSKLEQKLAELKSGKKNAEAAPVKSENREVLEFVPQAGENNDEIQAVIAAAIAAYEAENGCTIEKQPALSNGITIRTYRRK